MRIKGFAATVAGDFLDGWTLRLNTMFRKFASRRVHTSSKGTASTPKLLLIFFVLALLAYESSVWIISVAGVVFARREKTGPFAPQNTTTLTNMTLFNTRISAPKRTSPPSVTSCSPLMNAVEFEKDTEAFGCCTDYGPPLDRTMKMFLTEPCGFFIEAGAQDGVFQSNTLIFARKRGYRGLLIEPATSLCERLRRNRPESIVFNGALTSFQRDGSQVTMPSGSPMGTVSHDFVNGTATVPARALSKLLDEHNIQKVDFFSLDVEGHEAEILKGIDFNRHRPRFILIEVWNKNPQTFLAMERACYSLYNESVDSEGSLNFWKHSPPHRDFLFVDRHSGRCQTAPVHSADEPW